MSIVTAFFGADGRAATAHASLLLAYGLALTGRPTTLIRVVGEFDGMARFRTGLPRALEIVEYRTDAPDLAGIGIDAHLTAALRAGQRVVLDMPQAALSDPGLRERITLPVLLVGPTALDESLAAQVLRDVEALVSRTSSPDCRVAPLWLLGCGRSGTDAAATFEAAMRQACDAEGASQPVRALPLTLPGIGRSEADALARGTPGASLLRRAILNLAALEVAAADPFVPAIDRTAFVRVATDHPGPGTADDRSLQERLHDLADALAGLEGSGGVPAPEDLAEAPVLDDFAFVPDPRARIMRGVVQGHPNWPAPRVVTTSQVFATDGRTWARTLSRVYRLRRPEGDVVTH
ncbi:DUF6634 family protein [Methylobacterium sp. R2-1]|uniref:DUF6634 family protein n=1 Tax=Methylobacterium sp. R2-1 TaxID=2587064 RepID=UPI00160D8954|nr:DUF6634 family protein [Methylobacterium sp. R2-1]MBB2961915.1 hypothetical protein [Methylobacterium sp. R2-1]